MKHRVTLELYEYWQRIRAGRPAPERSEIEPADIRSILGDTFILEVIPEHDFRFRLAGTRLCALYGREMKGKDFLSFFAREDALSVATLLSAVAGEAAAAVLGLAGKSDHGRDLNLECLFLPVSQPGQGFTRILGSLVPMDDPYWVGIHPIMRQHVSSLRMIWPDERPHRLGLPPDEDGISAIPGGAHLAAPRRRVGHLTVYEGGKD
jgi:hypothetical protein